LYQMLGRNYEYLIDLKGFYFCVIAFAGYLNSHSVISKYRIYPAFRKAQEDPFYYP
jgi:hypothetical protein